MPTSVAVALAADFAATAIADAIIFDLVAATTLDWVASYAVLQAGASFVAGSVLRSALSGGAEDAPTSSPSFTAQAENRTHVIRSAVANRQIIYGRAMVSGPLVYAVSDASNRNLHLVIALAGHEIDAVEAVYFNDALGSDPEWSAYSSITTHLGTADQVADPDLVAAGLGWTADHRLAGVAYLYVKLIYSRDVFPRGIPNIKALVRGKKLYDPRTGLTEWSQNLALAVRDYLSGSYGLSSTDAEIDDTALIAAANICDEAVTLAAGGTEARYTVNGVLDTGNTPRANMEALLSGCGGALTWPAGRWTLHVGAYESPVLSLDEDDLAGAVQVRARVPRQDLYNAVKGTYIDPLQGYQPVDFPAVTNSTYATQDGAQIFRDVALPVTTSSATAQRLCKMMVEKSRQGITVQAAFKLSAFKAATWDNVTLSISALGWSSKVFKVTGWQFNESGSVGLTLQEEASACYTWSAEETIADPAPDTNLPDPLTVEAPAGITLASGTDALMVQADGTVVSRIEIEWSPPTSAMVDAAEIEFKKSAASDWITSSHPRPDTTRDYINDVVDGASYDVRLRFKNTLGVASAWTQAAPHVVIGKTAAPPDVTRFGVVEQPGGVRQFYWSMTSVPLDLMSWLVRWSPGTTHRAWSQMAPLFAATRDAREASMLEPIGDGDYVFAIKAGDTTGNQSPTALYVDATFDAGSLGTLAAYEFSHQADWPGAQSGCTLDAGALVGTGTTTWNDFASTTWADAVATDWTGGGSTIVYETAVLNAGAVASHAYRVSSVAAGTVAYAERHSDDNITWSAYAATSSTPITARYFQFRFTVTGADAVLYRAQSLVYA